MGGDKTAVAVCLCNSATYERGSLNGARRAGLCLIFEGCCCLNKPPCVPCNTICLARNVGRGSTPSQLSYRFGAAFFFFFFSLPFFPPFFPLPAPAKGFCVVVACKRLTSYLEHLEWLHDYQDNNYFLINFFFSPNSKSWGFPCLLQKGQLPLIISLHPF